MKDDMTADYRPLAWLMTIPGCDGSADWVEIGAAEPGPSPPAVALKLVSIDQAREMVAAERERCAKVAESRPLHGGMDEWDSTAAAIRGA